jgi:WD40 repeat protein
VFGLTAKGEEQFTPHWQTGLSDYVTAITWSADGTQLAAASGAGEVVVFSASGEQRNILLTENGQSIDVLAASHDSQYLAAGGQDGQVHIWQRQSEGYSRIASLRHAPAWVDQMAWSPRRNLLAFSIGKYVQVWDAEESIILTTLHFEQSSILSLTWHPDGDRLTVSGYQGLKIWDSKDWDDDPEVVEIDSACVAITWSPDGTYFAAGNMDRSITVMEWQNPYPWRMQGFPGKVSHLAWSAHLKQGKFPIFAAASIEGIVLWEKDANETIGWDSHLVGVHEGKVMGIAFQPGTSLLASAGEDGCLFLWAKAQRLTQRITDTERGFSCLAWHPSGIDLAAGGQAGEIRVWRGHQRGQGFARRSK